MTPPMDSRSDVDGTFRLRVTDGEGNKTTVKSPYTVDDNDESLPEFEDAVKPGAPEIEGDGPATCGMGERSRTYVCKACGAERTKDEGIRPKQLLAPCPECSDDDGEIRTWYNEHYWKASL